MNPRLLGLVVPFLFVGCATPSAGPGRALLTQADQQLAAANYPAARDLYGEFVAAYAADASASRARAAGAALDHLIEAQAEVDRLQRAAEARDAELAQVRRDLAEYRGEVERLRAEGAQAQAEVDRLQHAVEARDGELERLRHDLAERQGELERLQAEGARAQAEVDRSQHTIERRDAELAQLRRNLAERQSELDGLRAEGARLRADLDRLRKIDLRREPRPRQ